MTRITRNNVTLGLLLSILTLPTGSAWGKVCADKPGLLKKIFTAASTTDQAVQINCDITASDLASYPQSTITKRLEFIGSEASNVTFDCGGKTLDAAVGSVSILVDKAENADGTWKSRPANVTLKHCKVKKRIIIGAPGNHWFTPQSILDPSTGKNTTEREAYFTKYYQSRAPNEIHLDDITMTVQNSANSQFYFGWGVTDSSLTNSHFVGVTDGVPIYLAPESAHNNVSGNEFSVDATEREVIAIDGSAHNLIANNTFDMAKAVGGIRIFRNCGENGGVRVQKPWQNQLINNYFNYAGTSATPKAIQVAYRMVLRSDGKVHNVKDFVAGYPSESCAITPTHDWCCYSDDKLAPTGWSAFPWPSISVDQVSTQWPIGSGLDNGDNAMHTVATQNQINGRDPEVVIVGPLAADAGSNAFYTFGGNLKVTSPANQKAGCVFGYSTFVKDGDYVILPQSAAAVAIKNTCSDGNLSSASVPVKPFTCSKSDANAGCTMSVTCPSGKRVAGIRAACNLETTSEPDIGAMSWSTLNVTKVSDSPSDGKCSINTKSISTGKDVSLAAYTTSSTYAITAHCHEHDVNGGDCVIKGELLCL